MLRASCVKIMKIIHKGDRSFILLTLAVENFKYEILNMKITCAYDSEVLRIAILHPANPIRTDLSSPMPVGPHSPSALADTRRIRDHARVGVRHRSASGRRAAERRALEEVDTARATRRDGGAGQTDVSEQSERWRLIDWFVGGRIISRARGQHRHTVLNA